MLHTLSERTFPMPGALKAPCQANMISLQIYPLHPFCSLPTLPTEVPKVLPCLSALVLHILDVIPLLHELLYREL